LSPLESESEQSSRNRNAAMVRQMFDEKYNNGGNPFISVVAIYDENDEPKITEFLEDCPAGFYPELYEVILCKTVPVEHDDTCGLAAIYRAENEFPFPVRLFEWRYRKYSFGAARNAAKSAAKGAWILSLDMDEYVEMHTATSLPALCASANKKIGGFSLSIFSHVSRIGVLGYRRQASTHVRLFRNLPAIMWQGRCHEYVANTIVKAGLQLADSVVTIMHEGYVAPLEAFIQKLTRNANLLAADVALPEDDAHYGHSFDYLIRTCYELYQLREIQNA